MEEEICAAASHQRKRDEIRQNDLEEEVWSGHVTCADSPTGSCRMMQRVLQQAHKSQVRIMEQIPMRDVLHYVMTDGHSQK